MTRSARLLPLLFCLILLTGCAGGMLPVPWPPLPTSVILSPTPWPTIPAVDPGHGDATPHPCACPERKRGLRGPRLRPDRWRRSAPQG